METVEKRIALLKDGVVYNIVVGPSVEAMSTLFNCEAVEVTEETSQAYIGYGFNNGVFESPPPIPDIIITEESLEEEKN
jgi:hypothetical protein